MTVDKYDEWHSMYAEDARTTFAAEMLRYFFFALGAVSGVAVLRWLIVRLAGG